nr:15003_t:CDS:2 [Entrophospora candida]
MVQVIWRPIDVEQSEEIKNLTEVFFLAKHQGKEKKSEDHMSSIYLDPLCTWYEHGKYGKKVKPVKAYKLYLSSTKCDFSKAAYKVAQYCERNRDRLAQIDMLGDLKQESNHKQALIYLKQAAAKADEERPEPVDYAAKDFIKKAANLGYGPALYKMGHCYEYKRLTCSFNPLLSISYYKRASEVGEEKADLALGRWYLCGAKGCFDPDEALAYEYTEKAALKGIAEAELMMGYFYDAGIHVPANVQIANEWFTKAIIKMVQEVMTYFDNTPDKTTKLELIDTLRTVTEGKVCGY